MHTEGESAVIVAVNEHIINKGDCIYLTIELPDRGYVIHRSMPESADGYIEIYNAEEIMIGCIKNVAVVDISQDKNIANIKLKHNENGGASRAEDDPEIPGGYYIIVMGFTFYFEDFFSSGSWITRNGDISLSLTRKLSLWNQRLNGVFLSDANLMASQTWSLVRGRFRHSNNWYNEIGLWEQYLCHVKWSGSKNPYCLEPWRPAVGDAQTFLSLCNP